MAEPGADSPKKVAKRNDQKATPLYRNSRVTELVGEHPDFVYQTFSQDADSPAFIGKRLVPHEVGEPNGWKTMVGAWDVCHSQTDRDVRALNTRTDQNEKIDTVQRYGRQVRCRIHKDEFAKYAEVERANQKEREKQLFTPDVMRGTQASMTAIVMEGDQSEGARTQALIDAGHPIPGMGRGSV